MVSTLEQMQVQNGTGPSVRMSKRPVLASAKIVSTIKAYTSPQMGRNQVSGMVSVTSEGNSM